jgi:hypothetical protein
MVSGLTLLATVNSRPVRDEFITLTDPHVEMAFKEIFTKQEWNDFYNWTRSFYSLDAHMASVLNYDKEILPEPTDSAWLDVKNSAFELFSTFGKVTSRTIGEIDSVSFHENTSAGNGYTRNPPPYPGRKGNREQPNYARAKGIARKIGHELTNAHSQGTLNTFLMNAVKDSTPDIAFTRTQLAELPNTKVRNVFGEAFHYILLEGLSAEPLLDWFMKNDTFYYIGEDPLAGVSKLFKESTYNMDEMYFSIDWSCFDASVQPYEIELAFDLLKTMLIFPDKESELVFQYCKTLFIQRKLLCPDGRLFMRYGGVPSGSFFTHMVDSIINYNRIVYLAKLTNITPLKIRTHGDDGFVVFGAKSDFDFIALADRANEKKWYLNAEKCKLTTDVSEIEFLGRQSYLGRNRRNRLKCLRLCLYPEYPVDDPQISIARLKSIYVDSGGFIPEIPMAVHKLVSIYGDDNVELPRQFRRYNPNDYARTEGI